MGRYLAGVASALLLVAAGFFVWQGWAQEEELPPPPDPVAEAPADPMTAGAPGRTGPAPPEATELTREQRRFARYDRNRDNIITRTEMMSTRTTSFRNLDKDSDNFLTFEEWAVRTADRFASADRDGSGTLTPAEFATTQPRRTSRPSRCNC